jgi:hypothetical protein
MALTASDIGDRLDSAELRLEALLALDSPRRWRWFGPRLRSAGLAGANPKVRLRLAQEFLFHGVGAVDAVAQIVNDRRNLNMPDVTVRSLCARIEQQNANDPLLPLFGGLGQQTRDEPVPANPYTDDALLIRAMLYRHSVIHAHVHPFAFGAVVGSRGAPSVHLRIDPRLGTNDPSYGPNGNVSAAEAADELRRILALCRTRTTQVLALP